jgi:acetyl esterase/lipase
MKTYRDIAYAQFRPEPDAEVRTLLLNLYLPDPGTPPYPVIMWVHGGAWRTGSKENSRFLRMVDHSYAVASIEYRLSQEAIFPAQIHDCKAAVRWLRANAVQYKLDPSHIGAAGGSAGGHLVALLGTTVGVPELEGSFGHLDHPSHVQAVCDWYGPSDFLHMNDEPGAMDHDAADSPESQLIGAPIQEHPDLVARANPITYITPERTAQIPPFLIMHGSQDNVVIPKQSELLHQALQDVGAKSTLVLLEDLGHGFAGEHGRWDEIWEHVDTFFDQHLKT